jgi:rSAM/selenodomain-associated transferase 1
MSNTLVIFVKAPLAGDVKTRLIPTLSPSQAAELYQCFVRDVVRSMKSLKDVSVRIAYQSHARIPDPSWAGGSLSFFKQEGQSLGERLARAFVSAYQARAERVVVIGCDSPTLPAAYVQQAFRTLKDCDIVLGPATDGGFYLVGMSRFCPGLFDQVVWSSEEVFDKTMFNARRHGYSLRTLPAYFDVDTPEELEALWRGKESNGLEELAPLTGRFMNRIFSRRRLAFSA